MKRRLKIWIRTQADVARAALAARQMAQTAGFAPAPASRFATAVSELAGNVVKYAVHGEVFLDFSREGEATATVRDEGPGIADVDAALRDHFSTGGTLGLGLPGVKRLVDALEITSGADGTCIVAKVLR